MQSNQLRRVTWSARVFVLEDNFLNGLFIEDTLKFAGHQIVGPARTVTHALEILETDAVDAAILDLQIDDEFSYEVGLRLDQLHIPWAITTAHPPSFVGPQFSHIDLLAKPFTVAALVVLIEKLLDGRAQTDQSAHWGRGG